MIVVTVVVFKAESVTEASEVSAAGRLWGTWGSVGVAGQAITGAAPCQAASLRGVNSEQGTWTVGQWVFCHGAQRNLASRPEGLCR